MINVSTCLSSSVSPLQSCSLASKVSHSVHSFLCSYSTVYSMYDYTHHLLSLLSGLGICGLSLLINLLIILLIRCMWTFLDKHYMRSVAIKASLYRYSNHLNNASSFSLPFIVFSIDSYTLEAVTGLHLPILYPLPQGVRPTCSSDPRCVQ